MKRLNSLIKLSVNLDTYFFDILKRDNKQGSINLWENYCENAGLGNLSNQCLYQNLNQHLDSEEIRGLEENIEYLKKT